MGDMRLVLISLFSFLPTELWNGYSVLRMFSPSQSKHVPFSLLA